MIDWLLFTDCYVRWEAETLGKRKKRFFVNRIQCTNLYFSVFKLVREQEINLNQFDAGGLPLWQMLLSGFTQTDLKEEFVTLLGMSLTDSVILQYLTIGNIGHVTYAESFTTTKKTSPLLSALKSNYFNVLLIKNIIKTFPDIINHADEHGTTPLIAFVTRVLDSIWINCKN